MNLLLLLGTSCAGIQYGHSSESSQQFLHDYANVLDIHTIDSFSENDIMYFHICSVMILYCIFLAYGPAVIDHCLQSAGFPPAAAVGRGFDITCDLGRVLTALETAEELLVKSEEACRGYIIQKVSGCHRSN